ncbi:hypothetical protein G3I60_04960 [Streptomyces sp. SID13666]|uniref:hypothetical protein n=1 Tax=Streptomyces sp. SID13666 TaxID=2706054 RepID=UPI0013BF4D0E|nr:hypothetical protein [Streptomyces sp. SID13666]NEA53519.1 hypothetical protein [Streptomyces sp. SID13666]
MPDTTPETNWTRMRPSDFNAKLPAEIPGIGPDAPPPILAVPDTASGTEALFGEEPPPTPPPARRAAPVALPDFLF